MLVLENYDKLVELSRNLDALNNDYLLLSKNKVPETNFKTEKLQAMKSQELGFDCIVTEFLNLCQANWKDSEAIYLSLLDKGLNHSDENYYLSSWIFSSSRSLYANSRVEILKPKTFMGP